MYYTEKSAERLSGVLHPIITGIVVIRSEGWQRVSAMNRKLLSYRQLHISVYLTDTGIACRVMSNNLPHFN